MRRSLVAGLAWAACTAAGATTWTYAIDGLVPFSSPLPGAGVTTVRGRFSGSDLDGDGVLSVAEVIAFMIGDTSVVPIVYWPDPECACDLGVTAS